MAEQTVIRAANRIVGRLEAENAALVVQLRRLAIVRRYRLAYGRTSVPVGYLCKVCDQEWDNEQAETHNVHCVLSVYAHG